MTGHTETIEIIIRDERRRWSAAAKAALVRKTYERGISVSIAARQEGVSASLLFKWRHVSVVNARNGEGQHGSDAAANGLHNRWLIADHVAEVN